MKSMINKYIFGNPINTCAVEDNIPESAADQIQHIGLSSDRMHISYRMDDNDIVYGLGEQVRGINKRGWIYDNCCTDDSTHTEGKHSLYGAHNFIVIDGKEHFGLFIDTPGEVRFDIGYSEQDILEIGLKEPGYSLYLIAGSSAADIVHQFRILIGKSYIPPKWAFGFGQSRWSYMNENEVREVADRYRQQHIPLDSIYLDIDYMDHYKDFTVNEETFPEFQNFVGEMKSRHIHLVPIIDAGVKKEDGYPVYEEGKAKGYFCTDSDGNDFVAAVWPGQAMFPDFFQPAVREWFGNYYRTLTDRGIDGFWNDMNEPAIFYSERRLKKVFEKIEDYKGRNLDIQSFFEFEELIGSISNSPEDYEAFYHMADGRKIRHDKIHNLYGYNMTKAAAEQLRVLVPDKRVLLFSRSSYIGMHRYGGIWTGDNRSWWEQLELSVRQMPSLNMCGFLFSGSDIGGFSDDATADLMMRWLEFGIFTPLMRNHSASGTRRQELTEFPEMAADFSNIVGLRYMLMPYIYSEFMKAALTDTMYIRPLAFDYQDDQRARSVEDQLLVGESIMIAPVCRQNAVGRYVYIPEDMKMYRFRSETDFDTEYYHQGEYFIPAELNEVLIFVRPDRIVPLAWGAESVEQLNTDRIRIMDYLKEKAAYQWYDDNGEDIADSLQSGIRMIEENSSGEINIHGYEGEITKI